jgi:hypothetical protein
MSINDAESLEALRREWRWRWYFEGLSDSTREFMYALPEPEWQQWERRSAVLSHRRGEKGIEDSFEPPLAPWEAECFCAMKLLAGENWET